VKGLLEAWVARLAECRLEQKAGYNQHASHFELYTDPIFFLHFIIYVLESVTLIFLIVDNRCKAGEIVKCLKPRNTNAVVKPLTQKKKWKHIMRSIIRNLAANSQTTSTQITNHPYFLNLFSQAKLDFPQVISISGIF